MSKDVFDLVVIGAGSGGITAAKFGARVGAKVALVEKGRIGGDCTWKGCVPSKALLHVAKVAHTAKTAGANGIFSDKVHVNMEKVREYVEKVITTVSNRRAADYSAYSRVV